MTARPNDSATRAEREQEIRAKVGCDKAAYDIQWRLVHGAADESALREALAR